MEFDALLYGEEGMAERFGLLADRQRVVGKHDELPWRDVVAIPSDEISSRPAKSQ